MKASDRTLPADMRLLGCTITGKFYCRIRRNGGKYVDPKCFVRHEDAVERRNSILRSMHVCVDAGGVTVAQWSEQWLAKLSMSYRASKTKTKTAKDALDNLTSHVNAHVLKSSLAAIAVRSVTSDDIREFFEWLERRDTQRAYNGENQPDVLSKYTRRRIAVTLRKLFAAAVEAGECKTTPVGKITLGKDQRQNKRVAHEVPLTKAQQKQLIAAYGKHPDVHMVILIIWIGLRLGELLNLELCDVHIDEDDPSDLTGKRKRSYLDIKYGGPNHQPPKGRKTRQVELFGEAKRVVKLWRDEILPKYAPYNPHGLFFPTRQVKTKKGTIRFRGGCRRSGPPPSWKKLQKSKVLGRRVWWHCLRHTCATSLLNDWFGLGRRWSIEEVANVLGHSSKEVTEMYAHLADGAMRDRAAEAEASYQRNLAAAAGGDAPPAATPAPVHAVSAVPAPAATPQPTAPDGSLADAVQALLQRALREKDAATAQALFMVSMQQHGIPAPTTQQAPIIPPPAPVTPPPAPVAGPSAPPAVVEPPPAPVRLPRSMRKGPAGRRARTTIAADGDSEGPRKGGDLSQLATPSPGSTDGLGWFPSASANSARASGLSSEALTTTVETRRLTSEPGAPGVFLAVHPSTLELPAWRVAQATMPANNLQAGGAPGGPHAEGCTSGAPLESVLWQYVGNTETETEQYQELNLIERRSTEPKVGRSNRPGRAEQYQLVTTFPAPGYCQAIAKAPPEDERGPPPGRVEESEGAPAPSPLTEPPADQAPDAETHRARAQRLMRAVAAGRQDAWRMAEDLAMALLMSPEDKRHHEAATLVLKYPDLRVPRALELAVRLIGPEPKPPKTKKKRKP